MDLRSESSELASIGSITRIQIFRGHWSFLLGTRPVCRTGSRAGVAKVRFWERTDSALVSDFHVLCFLAHVLETLQFPHCFHVCCWPSSPLCAVHSLHAPDLPALVSALWPPSDLNLILLLHPGPRPWKVTRQEPHSRLPRYGWVCAVRLLPSLPLGIWLNAILYGRVPSPLFFYAQNDFLMTLFEEKRKRT